MKYISIIKSFYPSFSKQERKIADYVLKEKENVSYMSLQEITKVIKVSEATIVRFVKKIGFKGFIEFKLEIAKEKSNLLYETSDNYIENISNNILNVISSTKSTINEENVKKSIEIINKSNKMYIFGVGASGVAALEMQNRFLRYGKLSQCVIDTHFQTMYSSVVTEKDLIVVISLTGETEDLILPITNAKKNGCKIISITNYILSPIAKLSDIVLLTASKETPLDGGSLISKISQLYIIDVLATGYALKNEKKSKYIKQKISEAIAMKKK